MPLFLTIFATIMPLIPSLIQDVEALFGKGNGSAKKAAVTDMAHTAVNTLTTLSKGGQAETLNKLAPYISTMIDSAVAVANQEGVFGKDDPTASVTTQSNG